MTRDGLRLWWLIRQDGRDRCYVLQAYVKTDQDKESGEPAYEATIIGMEDRLVASGETPNEAERKAMWLLDDILEDAIASETMDECFAKTSMKAKSVEVPFHEMVAMIRDFVATTSAASPTVQAKHRLNDASVYAEPATEPAGAC